MLIICRKKGRNISLRAENRYPLPGTLGHTAILRLFEGIKKSI
jgi:hypothetical protein